MWSFFQPLVYSTAHKRDILNSFHDKQYLITGLICLAPNFPFFSWLVLVFAANMKKEAIIWLPRRVPRNGIWSTEF